MMQHDKAMKKQDPTKKIETFFEKNPTALVIYLLISLAIFCACTYYVHKWHNEMKEKNEDPTCGIKSCMCVTCCLCCGVGTCFTICFPIDEGPNSWGPARKMAE